MAYDKQCSDHMNQGVGVYKTAPKLQDSKAPALKGGVEQTGVPTSKQGK